MTMREIKRVPIRVSKEIHDKLHQAADLSGVPLNSFLIMTMNRHCDEILYEHFNNLFDRQVKEPESVWCIRDFDTAQWLVQQISKPSEPNQNLSKAFESYKRFV